jgi:hypothetical protein
MLDPPAAAAAAAAAASAVSAAELCNLAESQPETVAKMMARLQEYNDTAVPALCPPDDPASNPVGSNRSSDPKEFGSWYRIHSIVSICNIDC